MYVIFMKRKYLSKIKYLYSPNAKSTLGNLYGIYAYTYDKKLGKRFISSHKKNICKMIKIDENKLYSPIPKEYELQIYQLYHIDKEVSIIMSERDYDSIFRDNFMPILMDKVSDSDTLDDSILLMKDNILSNLDILLYPTVLQYITGDESEVDMLDEMISFDLTLFGHSIPKIISIVYDELYAYFILKRHVLSSIDIIDNN